MSLCFFKQKTAYEVRISDWSSDVCSSDLRDVAESREALDGLEESYRKEDISAWGRLHWAFHRRLYEPARRPRTLAMLQATHLQTERYIRLYLLMTEGRAGAARDNRELLRTCAHRDIEGARARQSTRLTSSHSCAPRMT